MFPFVLNNGRTGRQAEAARNSADRYPKPERGQFDVKAEKKAPGSTPSGAAECFVSGWN
jgi:hypothetical protein